MLNKNIYNLKFIKFIKYIFLLIVAFIVAVVCYFIFSNQNSKIRRNDPLAEEKSKEDINFRVEAPNLVGIDFKNGPYYIKAKEMHKISDNIYLSQPQVKLMMNQVDWLNAVAEKAKLIHLDQYLLLENNLRLNLNQKYFFTGKEVEIFAKEALVKSKNYIKLYTDNSNLESEEGFILNYNEKTASFNGKINANIIQAGDKSNTNIKSDKLDVFWLEKKGDFIGNVLLTKASSKVTAEKMIAMLNKKNDQLETIYAYGKVKIADSVQTATSEYGEYSILKGILTLKGNVTLKQKTNIMTGELLHYNLKTQKAELIGAKKSNRVKAVINPPVKKNHE